jgi:hypothetical protein
MTGFGQHVRWTDERVSDRPAFRWRAEAMLFVAAYLASTSSPPEDVLAICGLVARRG